MQNLNICYIGLGSNLDAPMQQVTAALVELNQICNTRVLQHSSLYQSKPHGPQDQEDFINAVAEVATTLTAHELLSELQNIENQHQKVFIEHWGPRSLDLDILLYGDKTINTALLSVPHPFIYERDFVLYPLDEINSEMVLPNGESLAQALSALQIHACAPIKLCE